MTEPRPLRRPWARALLKIIVACAALAALYLVVANVLLPRELRKVARGAGVELRFRRAYTLYPGDVRRRRQQGRIHHPDRGAKRRLGGGRRAGPPGLPGRRQGPQRPPERAGVRCSGPVCLQGGILAGRHQQGRRPHPGRGRARGGADRQGPRHPGAGPALASPTPRRAMKPARGSLVQRGRPRVAAFAKDGCP